MDFLKYILLFVFALGNAQALTIEDAYAMARENYPLIKRNDLIEKTKEYNVENAAKGWLPQIQISGQASYQTDVTKIPVSLPGLTIEPPGKDQYKIYADVQQNIYDGGLIGNRKKLAEAQSEAEKLKNESDLDALKERINQLFFGIIQTDEQTAALQLSENDIDNTLKRSEAQLKNGVIFRSSVDELKAQKISLQQRKIELKAVRKTFTDMLSVFIGKKLDENAAVQKPDKLLLSETNNRTELKLFDAQKQALEIQKKMVKSGNLPKIGAFLQAGYGKPGLNMLKNSFDPYAIGGIRLNIPISGWYTFKNDIAILDNQQQDIEIQRENFLFNQNIQNLQNQNDLQKIQNLIDTDEQLISLRKSIKTASQAQLENGVITTSDYLQKVNAEEQARIQKILHETQYLLSQYNLKAHLNN